MHHRIVVAYVFAIVNYSLSTVVFAQPQMTGVITLSDAVSASLESNPSLTSYPLRKDDLLGQRESADLGPELSINVEVENVLGTDTLRGFDGSETSLSLSSVIEMGGKRSSRINVLNRRIDLLDAQQGVAELDLIAETTFRFIDVLAAQERLALQVQAVELAQQTISMLEPLVSAGQTHELELSRAQAALHRASIAENYAKSLLLSMRLKLSTLWGSQSAEFSKAAGDFYRVGESGALSSMLLTLDSNPNIAIYANEQRLVDAQLREVKSQSQANIQWSAGIRHLKEINDTGFIFSISRPLFNQERSTGALRSAQANLAEVQVRREISLNAIRGQLFSLYEQLTQAISETSILQKDVLPLLNDISEQTQIAYQNGRYSYLDLISSQQEYLDAHLALINSAATAHTLRSEIERLSGEPLTR